MFILELFYSLFEYRNIPYNTNYIMNIQPDFSIRSSQVNFSMNSQFENVIKHGTYYYPADRHYYSGCIVRCDRCDRTNLKASIGYHEIDLCLACASQIESLLPRINPPSILPTTVNPPTIPFSNPPFIRQDRVPIVGSGETFPIISPPRNYTPSHQPTHFFSSNNQRSAQRLHNQSNSASNSNIDSFEFDTFHEDIDPDTSL
jgi:hypothetical protein